MYCFGGLGVLVLPRAVLLMSDCEQVRFSNFSIASGLDEFCSETSWSRMIERSYECVNLMRFSRSLQVISVVLLHEE